MSIEDIYKKFLAIASEYFGERAAYEHADVQRDKAIEQLLISKNILTTEEIDQKTGENLIELIKHIEARRGTKSPFQRKDIDGGDDLKL